MWLRQSFVVITGVRNDINDRLLVAFDLTTLKFQYKPLISSAKSAKDPISYRKLFYISFYTVSKKF